jgi:hypothetical protein
VPEPDNPVEDLSRFQQPESADEYRHRMTVNIAGFAILLLLVGGGIWLADTMAQVRKTQDCFIAGRRNCTPVGYPDVR